eukprot:3397492-Karenia_brevis.AAC.1
MSNIDVCKEWPAYLMVREDGRDTTVTRNLVSFALDTLVDQLPQYDDKDFLIAKRGSEWEVWTLKDFKPGTIQFAPETTEIKPRFWTANRGCIVEHTKVGQDNRPMVCDGRIRASPDGKSRSAFALFWLVPRQPAKEDQSAVNLELRYVSMSIAVTFEINGKEKDQDWDKDVAPSLPILTNPSKIKKHTKLL